MYVEPGDQDGGGGKYFEFRRVSASHKFRWGQRPEENHAQGRNACEHDLVQLHVR
jgi:hypothetical protein